MTFIAGLVFYWPVLQWMRVADPAMYFAWGILATYCALYFPIGLYFIRYLDRRTSLPLAISAPLVWTALEYLRSQLGTGFSWYLIGHTQHDCLSVIQIADLAGAFGVTFLVVIVNGLLAELVFLHPAMRRFVNGADTPARYSRNIMLVQLGVVAALLLATCGYGVYRLGQNKFLYGPRIALIQGNLDQRIRNDPNRAIDAGQHFVDLCDLAAESPELDLLVWPETSYPPTWREDQPGVPSDWNVKDAEGIAERWKNPVLLGLKADIPDRAGNRAEYNSALLLVKGKPIDRYDKIHLVPLGEYIPFRHTIPLMKELSPYDFDYSVESGWQHTRFPLTGQYQNCPYTFGVAICYEDTDPDVTRPYGGGSQPPVDFILNTSNDGWFNGTSEHEEHLAISRFRAIECRRCVARSVNMGISAVIDPNGRVLAPREIPPIESPPHGDKPRFAIHHWRVDDKCWDHELPVAQWSRFKKVAGILEVAIPIDERTSFYAHVGDWLPWTCWTALAVGMFVGSIRRLRRA